MLTGVIYVPDTLIANHSGRARAPWAKQAGAKVARTVFRLSLNAAPVLCTASHCALVLGARTPSAASCAESNKY